MPTKAQLKAFVKESWKIEGLILGESLQDMMRLHQEFLNAKEPGVFRISNAASFFTSGVGRLRDKYGMDVQVGDHTPPRGAPNIRIYLEDIMRVARKGEMSPYHVHGHFETIHPFLDGNGRTGRLLWAWTMERDGKDPYFWDRGFLHTWYYQSLSAGKP